MTIFSAALDYVKSRFSGVLEAVDFTPEFIARKMGLEPRATWDELIATAEASGISVGEFWERYEVIVSRARREF